MPVELDLIDEWSKVWNQNALVDCEGNINNYFFHTFINGYREIEEKKDKNKNLNIAWKFAFILTMLAYGIFICYYIKKNISKISIMSWTIFALVLFVLILLCSAISKWIDVKKYQETWVRHSNHLHLLDNEMLLFLYGMEPYNGNRNEEVFMKRIMNIEDKNQQKFSDNMENKEKEMMDIFDKLKGIYSDSSDE